MAGMTVLAGSGQLTVNAVELITEAWQILDLSPLWGASDLRGTEDVVIDGVVGRRAYPRILDETSYMLRFHIIGEVDVDGDPHATPYQGLYENLQYLWDKVLAPPDAPDALRPAVLTLPDGITELEADVFVRMELGDQVDGEQVAALSIVIPAGRFVPIGS